MSSEPSNVRRRFAPLRWLAAAWRFCWNALGVAMKVAFGFVLAIVLVFSLANFVASTPRIGAYRILHPASAACRDGLQRDEPGKPLHGWTIMAEVGAASPARADTDEWIDETNDEGKAILFDKAVRPEDRWATRLRCAVQAHVIPSKDRDPAKALTYDLGFLEFKENGEPYPLIDIDADGKVRRPDKALLEPDPPNPNNQPVLTQLDALKVRLAGRSNYVLVFVHGWRHNASIGDGNVQDLRHYAAHAASFLKQRCGSEGLYCDTRVTAIYVGWRGARVDEVWATRKLGRSLGEAFGSLAAGATLFDRKPVSEQVAPGAISALRSLERVLAPTQSNGAAKEKPFLNRMIVFGHSLGGNMLATGLQDDLVKMVREHQPGQHVPPVLGDLVVLINPASEAAKWTSVQREVWRRIPFHVDRNITIDDVAAGHAFFRVDQNPVIVSVTSAFAFPPGGLRTIDCDWLLKRPNYLQRVYRKGQTTPIDYDWATEDLFPTFKLDFRPLSQRLERLEAELQGHAHAPGQSCDDWNKLRFSGWRAELGWLESVPVHVASAFFANLPFQNFDQEQSHTIGHLDPPRPADGLVVENQYASAAPFGTTHELFGPKLDKPEEHHAYATLADEPPLCAPANLWLKRARTAPRVAPFGTFWTSDDLAPADAGADPPAKGEGPPAARFLHGANFSGAAAITRANDPFWNMRAFDNALASHDGYRLSSFICAMNQLVMDNIAGDEARLSTVATDPTQVPNPVH